jgi:hypothetical protein
MSDRRLEERLHAAEHAYHNLRMGYQAVRVRMSDGSETEFNKTTEDKLRAYVDELRDEVNGIDRPRHGAINFVF